MCQQYNAIGLTTLTQLSVCAALYVQTCSVLILGFKLYINASKSSSVQENVVYVPLCRESTYKKATSSHMFSWRFPAQVQLSSSLPPNVLLTASAPLLGLPYTSIVFDWAQFRLGVWRQSAPRGLRAKSQNRAGGGLRGTHVACDPKHPNAAVHPVL